MHTTQFPVRQALPSDIYCVTSILLEAAAWLEQRGMGMWRTNELAAERIAQDVATGSFYVADVGQPIGTIKFQLTDTEFWPDFPGGDSAFVHRLAVRRDFAGQGVSAALLNFAADHALASGRRFLRLDCEASRTRLRAVYERFGFRHHSDRQVGPYFVARYELDLLAPTVTPRR
jgi:GNAT superfamily N-acetyltransferase